MDRLRLAGVELVIFDFDGVFTDNCVYVDQSGNETVRCWRSDGLGISKLKAIGLPVWIVSTEKNPVVAARAKKLHLPCIQAVEDKGAAVLKLCSDLGIEADKTMFVGNDINDIAAFRVAGVAVAVADAHPDVDPFIRFRTKAPGGRGAVREICDLLIELRGAVKESGEHQ